MKAWDLFIIVWAFIITAAWVFVITLSIMGRPLSAVDTTIAGVNWLTVYIYMRTDRGRK